MTTEERIDHLSNQIEEIARKLRDLEARLGRIEVERYEEKLPCGG